MAWLPDLRELSSQTPWLCSAYGGNARGAATLWWFRPLRCREALFALEELRWTRVCILQPPSRAVQSARGQVDCGRQSGSVRRVRAPAGPRQAVSLLWVSEVLRYKVRSLWPFLHQGLTAYRRGRCRPSSDGLDVSVAPVSVLTRSTVLPHPTEWAAEGLKCPCSVCCTCSW